MTIDSMNNDPASQLHLNLVTPNLLDEAKLNFCLSVGLSAAAAPLLGVSVAAGAVVGVTAAVAGRAFNKYFEVEVLKDWCKEEILTLVTFTTLTVALTFVITKLALTALSMTPLSFPCVAGLALTPLLVGIGTSLISEGYERFKEYRKDPSAIPGAVSLEKHEGYWS